MTRTPVSRGSDSSASKYRIAIVHPSAGVNWSGGTENFAIEMARHLDRYFDVELLGGDAQIPHYYPAGGVPRNRARKLIQFPPLNRALRKISTNPDIVIEHLTSFFPCAARLLHHPADLIFPCNSYGGLAVAALVRQVLGTPVLYKAHNGLLSNGKPLRRDLKFRPDHLVVFSEEMRQFAHAVQPAQSVSIIPNGVDLQRFTPLGDRLDLALPGPIVLCVASLNRQGHKRVDLAIQAVSKLRDVSLLICGDGADREYYRSMGNRLIGPARFSIRTYPFDQMPMVYRSVDVFTLSSIQEPFGNVYTQAMASGLPVVTTDDALRQFIVAEAGILCDVTDASSYAENIKKALASDWTSKALASAKRFRWEIIAKRYRDLMLQMIHSCAKP
ncbi:MAG: glycosyltransferase [Phormidesmis sp.]